MDDFSKKAIEEIVDSSIRKFALGLEDKYTKELSDPNGVINRKRNNYFIAELGKEFMFYNAFARSFDSSFGKLLENIGNSIAKLNYTVKDKVSSFILPENQQHINTLIFRYQQYIKPKIDHYRDYNTPIPRDIRSFMIEHKIDHYFYDSKTKIHYLLELKSGGDLDNKKAKAEKIALLEKYFILKNSFLTNQEKPIIKVFFATAYNIFGENKPWKQERVRQFFADEELLIGKKY